MAAVVGAGGAAVTAVTAADVAERARVNTHNNTNRSRRENDRTYTSEWSRYRQWVLRQRDARTIPPGPKYLTRENIDLFFSQEVCNRIVVPDTARRVVSSLQRFADDLEYTDGSVEFSVDSPVVKRALETHKRLYMERISRQVEDPHANLPTNVLTEADCVKALFLAARGINWKDLMLCWATCEQTYLRNHSMRKLTLCNLCCNTTHAPSSMGDKNYGAGYGYVDGFMMSYILDKYVHKTRDKKKRVVGAWRHKNYIRCSVGNLAMNLFVRLYADSDIDFHGERLNEKMPRWWNRKLIVEWTDEKSSYSAFCALLDAAQLQWAKKTHLRKLGMAIGTTRGELETHKITTMSKHKTEKGKMAVYETELFPPVLRVMSGFQQQSCYFVERTRLFPTEALRQHQFPNGQVRTNEYEAAAYLIFPRIGHWRAQYHSPSGDHSEAANNFLFYTLPYLAVTAIQDGIYWLRDLPRHEATRLLLHAMPPWYPRWAANARNSCIQMQRNREIQEARSMGDGSIAAFSALQSSITEFSTQMTGQMAGLTGQLTGMSDRLHAVETGLSGLSQQQHTLAIDEETVVAQQLPPPPPPPPPPPATRVAAAVAAAQRVPAQRTVNDMLRNIPRVPAVPNALPPTMSRLLTEHLVLDLVSFQVSNRTGWPDKLQNSFSKRQYLYSKIVDKAKQRTGHRGPTNENALAIAAGQLDAEKGDKTVNQYLKYLKASDSTTKTRQKRKRNDL